MLRRLLRLWMCWIIAVFISLGCPYFESSFAQMTRNEPNILGVSNSLIADWQWKYGGGPGLYGCGSAPGTYWIDQPLTPPAFMEPFPLKKAKRSKALKKIRRK